MARLKFEISSKCLKAPVTVSQTRLLDLIPSLATRVAKGNGILLPSLLGGGVATSAKGDRAANNHESSMASSELTISLYIDPGELFVHIASRQSYAYFHRSVLGSGVFGVVGSVNIVEYKP